MGKRYFWLKLQDNFFDQKEIKRLRRLAGGDTYTIIYLKVLLLSLKSEGKIYFDGVGDDFSDELSLQIDENTENIKVTMAYLQSKGLVEEVNESELFMSDIPSMIGSETDVARRVRKHRQNPINLESNTKTLQSNNSETKSNTEIEIDKEIDKEKNKERDKEKDYAPVDAKSKREYADFVFLTEDEYRKLNDLLKNELQDYFIRFGSWISGQTVRVQKSRSAYLTILNWHREDLKKRGARNAVNGRGPENHNAGVDYGF